VEVAIFFRDLLVPLVHQHYLLVHCVQLLVYVKVANKGTIWTYLHVSYVLALLLYQTAFSVTPHLCASIVKVGITYPQMYVIYVLQF
jgi:hypothetical protein